MRRFRIASPVEARELDLTPQGFLLSEAALYSFFAQDVYPDVFSFCSAIPDHLKQLFLIPVRLEPAQDPSAQTLVAAVAARIAGDTIPTGQTPEGDLFSYNTFNYGDGENTVAPSDPGSIFDIGDADDMTHHQENVEDQDTNVQVPSDTSYMSDVDLTESDIRYPYRIDERPVRHSSEAQDAAFSVLIAHRGSVRHRVALKPEQLEPKAPGKIKDNAESCKVALVSYDKRGRVFTFNVDAGNGAKNVRASLTDLDHVAMTCDCAFWRYNGPEFHARSGGYLLGAPHGTAAPPDVRDPDRQYYLCKHTYAVLKRLDEFVADVTDENWDLDDEEAMAEVDKNWDKMAEVAEVPMDDFEDEVVVDWDEPGEEGDVDDADPGDLDAAEIEEGESEDESDEAAEDLEKPELEGPKELVEHAEEHEEHEEHEEEPELEEEEGDNLEAGEKEEEDYPDIDAEPKKSESESKPEKVAEKEEEPEEE